MQPMESEFYEPSPLLRELQVLSILARDPEASQKEIATQVGLAPSMIHNYIHALADQGFVQFQGPTRRQLRYIVTHSGRGRIESLATRHIADTGRLIEKITSRLRRDIEGLARDGVRRLGIVARPALARTLLAAATEIGMVVQQVGEGEGLPAGADGFEPGSLDAILVAEDPLTESVSATVQRCKEAGIKVLSLA